MTGKEEAEEEEENEGEEVAPALVTSSARRERLEVCVCLCLRACVRVQRCLFPPGVDAFLQRLTANKTQGRLELQQPLNASNHVKQVGMVECSIA